jgi:hypothetical protein
MASRDGLLAAEAFALTGLISPLPPLAGPRPPGIATYRAAHNVGLEIESVADGIGAMFLVIYPAPAGILAAGGLRKVVAPRPAGEAILGRYRDRYVQQRSGFRPSTRLKETAPPGGPRASHIS